MKEKQFFTAKDLKEGVIYKYTCPEGKVYIGQTYNERNRRSQHKNDTSKDTRSKFGQALIKFGYENFKYEIILKFKPTADLVKLKRVLNKLERRYIRIYDSDINGYNITKGGEGVLGLIHSKEVRKQMSESRMGRIVSEETKEKISKSNLGKNTGSLSEETKEKMHTSAKNKKQVYQLDLEENVINTFDSIAEAARSINNYDANHKTKSNRIAEVCSGKRKSIYGFI